MKVEADIFGYIGSVLLPITLIPQLYHTYKSKKVDDISYIFICLQILTCIFFFTYGIFLDATPLIIANSLVFLQLIVLMSFKIKYSKKNKIIKQKNKILVVEI